MFNGQMAEAGNKNRVPPPLPPNKKDDIVPSFLRDAACAYGRCQRLF